jgi:hypothetical protein
MGAAPKTTSAKRCQRNWISPASVNDSLSDLSPDGKPASSTHTPNLSPNIGSPLFDCCLEASS